MLTVLTEIKVPLQLQFVKYLRHFTLLGWGGGGYSRFQAKGIIKGFFGGLKFSVLGFFWVGKFGKYFFVWLD